MKQIAEAIKNVMDEVNGVAKNMTVGTGGNSYKGVSDKDVKLAIRESMIKNWLSILPITVTPKIQIDRWEEEVQDYTSKQMVMRTKQSVFTEAETKYLLLHTSWESIELAWYGQGVDSQDKGAGKATTYALKNTLLNMFLIPTGVDTDDTHSDDLPVPKSTYKAPAQSPAPTQGKCIKCGASMKLKADGSGSYCSALCWKTPAQTSTVTPKTHEQEIWELPF